MRRLLIYSLLLLVGCNAFTGEEVGRLAINKISSENEVNSQETIIKLEENDEIVFWSELDLEYDGNVDLRFRVVIKKDGERFKNFDINPFERDLTIGESKSVSGDKTSWKFSGQNLIFNVQESGEYTFKAVLLANDNESLIVKKAELVLKKI